MTGGSDRAFLGEFDGSRSVTVHGDGTDIVVADRAERQQFVLGTDRTVNPAVRDPEDLLFPVDTAAAVTAGWLTLSGQPTVSVRDSAGEMLADAGQPGPHEFPAGDYYLDVEAPGYSPEPTLPSAARSRYFSRLAESAASGSTPSSSASDSRQ